MEYKIIYGITTCLGFTRVIWLSVVICLPVFAHAQSFAISQFTTHEGLPTRQINCLVQDRLGYLWIGTYGGGLVRFDGKEFITYTRADGLASNYVMSLTIDQYDRLWIGTLSGLSKYDGAHFHSIRSISERSENDSTSFIEKAIDQVRWVNDKIVVRSRAGFVGTATDESILWNDKIRDAKHIIGGDALSNIWIRDRTGRVIEFPGGEVVESLFVEGKLYDVLQYGDEQIFNTDNGIVFPDHFLVPSQMDKNTRGPVVVDSVSHLLWATGGEYLSSYSSDSTGGFKRVDFDKIRNVTSWVNGKSGVMWFGTYMDGLFQVKSSAVEKIYQGPPSETIFPIAKNKGRIPSYWFGTWGDGLIFFSHAKTEHIRSSDLRKNFINGLKLFEDYLLVGSMGGLGKLDPTTKQISWLHDDGGQDIDSILDVDVDSKGRLWIARALKGVTLLQGDSVKNMPSTGRVVVSLKYSDFDSTLYAGTNRGILAFRGANLSRLDIPLLQREYVRSLDVFKDKYLVFTTEGYGVWFYDAVAKKVFKVGLAEGLPSPILYFVKCYGDYVWVGTVKGLCRIRPLDGFEKFEVTNFDGSNGFGGEETNQNSIYIDNQEVLFASVDGVYKIDATKEVPKSEVGKLHLQLLSFRNKGVVETMPMMVCGLEMPHDLKLDAGVSNLSFSINRVNYASTDRAIRYRLRDMESGWTHALVPHTVVFNALPHGSYYLEVVALNQSGDEIEKVVFPFAIKTPWYQSSLFVLAALVTILLLSIFFFRLQLKIQLQRSLALARAKLEENKRLRQEIARDFHDEMGNHIVSMINNANVLLLKSKEPSEKEFLSRIANSAKLINLHTRDFIWSINPANNSLEDLFLYLRDFAVQLFNNSQITFRSSSEIDFSSSVSYKQSREIILICKEALTNALKHSEARNVGLFLKSSEDGEVEIEVLDDGKGMVQVHKKTGGLDNMSYRAKKIGCQLKIDSVMPKGLSVRLILF